MWQTAAALVPTSAGETMWRRAIGWFSATLERRRQRRALAELDDHLLKDIGLSRDEARRESRKPLWC